MIITSQERFSRKALVITVAVVLLLVASAVTYVYAFNGNLLGWKLPNTPSHDKKSIDYGPATKDQQNNGTIIKSNSTQGQDGKPGISGSDQPSSPTPVAGSTQKNVSMTISAANQNGSTLQIRALIGAVENTGTCTLTLTQVGQSTITKIAGTQAQASTSTCKGFDIPTSGLTTGVWHIVITYDSPLLTGMTTKDVTIR